MSHLFDKPPAARVINIATRITRDEERSIDQAIALLTAHGVESNRSVFLRQALVDAVETVRSNYAAETTQEETQ